MDSSNNNSYSNNNNNNSKYSIYIGLKSMKNSKCFTRDSGGLLYAATGSCCNSYFENNQ